MSVAPSRGEVWVADLKPSVGNAQAGPARPVVILSTNSYNHGPSGMVVVAPITSKDKGIPLHVEVAPPEGGLTMRSFVMCDQVRAISTNRFTEGRSRGLLSSAIMAEIEDRVRILLDL